MRTRLELVLRVCEAVQYAHRNLIIHRDIKPANILVTADGWPKLLDFGIAKVLQPDRQELENFALTVPGLRLLTPEYASPEQLRGEPLTTATDVYSLGVLLFELLTDERPHDLLLADHQTWEAAIRETPPSRPSTRLRERALERTESSRRDEELRASKAVAGDLDNIVLMALRPEPDRRYGSVEQLAADIRRYLRDLPVRARADTLEYRLGKFVRRHRLPVSIAIVSAIILITVSLIALRQARLATRAQITSDRLSELLVNLFEMPDPEAGRGNTVTAREILDRGAEQTFRGLEDQPDLKARFMDTIGRAYNNLGIYEQAEDLFAGAVQLRSDGELLTWADSLNHLGEAQFHRGSFDQAEAHFRQSLELRRQAFGDDRPELAESLLNLGALSLVRRDLETTERLWEQALDLRRRHLGEHGDLAEVHDNLGTLRSLQGRTDEAESHLRRALDLHVRFHGESHHQTLRTLANLAAFLHRNGDLEAAEALYRNALTSQISALGAGHPHVAKSSSNLAALLALQGETEEAEALLRPALRRLQQSLGAEHYEVTYPMIHLADLLVQTGESGFEEAEELYREVQRIRSQVLPARHVHQVSPLLGWANLTMLRGDHVQAEALALEALQLSSSIQGATHPISLEARDLLDQARAGLDHGASGDITRSTAKPR